MSIACSKFFFLICLALLYATWGSSFIISQFSLHYAPGLMLGAIRMICSGLVLIAMTRCMGEKLIFTIVDIKNNCILGFFLVFIASSLVTKGQESVASGTTAMLLGIIPTWMILSDWYFEKLRPSLKQFLGVGIGFFTIVWMQWYQGNNGQSSLGGFLLIVLSTLGWVYGSRLSLRMQSGTSMTIFRSTGLMMLCGGLESFFFALLAGEKITDIYIFSPLIFIILLHICTNIIGYLSYFWLLKNTSPMLAISYEFVNPVVALFLGWLLAGEVLHWQLLFACMFLVVSVFLAVEKQQETAAVSK